MQGMIKPFKRFKRLKRLKQFKRFKQVALFFRSEQLPLLSSKQPFCQWIIDKKGNIMKRFGAKTITVESFQMVAWTNSLVSACLMICGGTKATEIEHATVPRWRGVRGWSGIGENPVRFIT